MNRWRLSKDWALVWGFTFLLVGLIFYMGYRNTISINSSERDKETSTEECTTLVGSSQNSSAGSPNNEMALKLTSNEETSLDHEDNNLQNELILVLGRNNNVTKSHELKDFPSPVKGKPIRNVGNYYSEVSGSGDYVFHSGLDYALLEGTVIRATCGGKVVFSGPDPILGRRVTLNCGEGWMITYGGLDNLRVQEGETVETQEALGQVGFYPGAEGINGRPQLHYEIWHGNIMQRPLH